MKIFLSSPSFGDLQRLHMAKPELKPNVLVTYYNLTHPQNYTQDSRHMIDSLCLDCGAYSLNAKGLKGPKLISAQEELFRGYKAYIVRAQNKYNFAFSMDDEFGPDQESFEHNLLRFKELQSAGADVVPVIHNLKSNEVDYYIDQGVKMIAIGQCHDQNRNDLTLMFPVAEKIYKAGVKLHLFGMTNFNTIANVPAYSCDSKSWLDNATYGKVLWWNPESPKMDKTEVIYFPGHEGQPSKEPGIPYREYAHLDQFKAYICENLSLEFNDLLGLHRDFNRKLVNVLYYILMEERINKMHAGMGIVFD